MTKNTAKEELPIGQKYEIRRERVHYGGPNGLAYEGRTISYLCGGIKRIFVFVPAESNLLSHIDLNEGANESGAAAARVALPRGNAARRAASLPSRVERQRLRQRRTATLARR